MKEKPPISEPNRTESGTTAKTGNFDKRQAHVEQSNVRSFVRSELKLIAYNLLVMDEAQAFVCVCVFFILENKRGAKNEGKKFGQL